MNTNQFHTSLGKNVYFLQTGTSIFVRITKDYENFSQGSLTMNFVWNPLADNTLKMNKR